MRAYLFSGQGSQHKGMGGELFERFPAMVDIADRVLGYSTREMCADNPENRLSQTQFTQPLVFLVDALKLEHFKEEGHQVPSFVAGHSLGEYAALLAAEAFDLETGLRLVQKRANAMAEIDNGGMAAVVGCPGDELADILAGAQCPDLVIANRNTALQNVVSGPIDQLDLLEPLVQDAGHSFVPLPVSGAFHSSMMGPAREVYTEALRSVEFNWLRTQVVSNVEARPYSQGKIKSLLSLQITEPVRWYDSIMYMKSMGVREFVEVGPGSVLTNMLKKIEQEISSSDSAESRMA